MPLQDANPTPSFGGFGLMSRARSGPTLSHQLLVYPMLDCDYDTPSYLQNADGFLLTRDSMIWFWNHYLRSDDDKADPYPESTEGGRLVSILKWPEGAPLNLG